jgi:hypothetical protein
MPDGGETPLDYATARPYPVTVTIAGIAWIAFGGLILLNLLVVLLILFVAAAGQQGGGRGAFVAGGVCGALLLGLFGAVFIHVGVQSVRGTARDTLGNGIGSIIFGVLNLGAGAAQAGAAQVGAAQVIQAGVGFLAGAGLIAAGVLALVGRNDYKAWRQAQNPPLGAAPGR